MSPRGTRASVAAGLLTAVTVGVAAPAAMACSCAIPSAATINRADVVFTGTVTARSDPTAGQPMYSSADPITYAIAVDGELKGDVDVTAQVVTARDSASCGVDFEVGKRYFVVADRPETGGALTTGLCQGTQALPAGEPLPEFARGLEASAPGAAPASWPAPSRISPPAKGTDPPQVALSPTGRATLAWVRTTYVPGSERFAASRLLAATRPAGGTFGVPEVISADDELAVSGAVAAAGETHLAVWVRLRAGGDGPAIMARARRAGTPWEAPEVLDSTPADLGLPQPRVAGSPSGEALAVWATGDRGLRAATFTPAGGWADAVTIAPAVVTQPVSVALGPDGTAVATWWERVDGGAVARAVVRAPGGAWGAPLTLSRPFAPLGDLPFTPPHSSAAAGNALVVWTQSDRTLRGSVHAALLGPEGPRGLWRLATLRGAASVEGALDPSGRGTVVWSQARGCLGWVGQDADGRWTEPRPMPTAGAPCEGGLVPRLAVAPDGVVHAIWTQSHRRGLVVVATARRPGEAFAEPRAISRAEVAPVAALAVSEAGGLAAWARASLGARARPFIEAAIIDRAGPPVSGLLQFEAPRLDDVRVPSEIALRAPVPIGFRLSRPARVEVRFQRVRPSTRFVGPFRRGGRAGANTIQVPSWAGAGRRLGPGVYEMYIEAMTAERASCTIARRLVVRG